MSVEYVFCLKGVRRVVWGDLGYWVNQKPVAGNSRKFEVSGPLEHAKEDHAKFLILSIARRTNRFRIATYITKLVMILAIILFAFTAGITGISNFISQPLPFPAG